MIKTYIVEKKLTLIYRTIVKANNKKRAELLAEDLGEGGAHEVFTDKETNWKATLKNN